VPKGKNHDLAVLSDIISVVFVRFGLKYYSNSLLFYEKEPVTNINKKVAVCDKLTLRIKFLLLKVYFFGCSWPAGGVVVVTGLVVDGVAVGSVGIALGSTVLSI
jgi:hypothetical protein